MNEYGQFNNPYMNMMNTNSYYYVNGIEGAKAFQVQPNKTVLLMDSENPIFYMKSSNNLGQATMKKYKFEEVVEKPEEKPVYATKEDVEEIVKKYFSMMRGGNTDVKSVVKPIQQ